MANYTGMHVKSGRAVGAAAHLAQSISDILTTPIGTREMRRAYGSLLFELIDRPMNARVLAAFRAAIADAISRWEPRVRLTQVRAWRATDTGKLEISIDGVDIATGASLSLRVHP